ncbi:MAG: hypothetical protein IK127_09265 [Clostridia bacterium]|nr:hypothetical protein [Clostridia bacterium]
MKKLVATLLALVMISTCSVGLASNSNINSFVNNFLDALINFNIDSQALQVEVDRVNTSEGAMGSDKLATLLFQKKGGMYQLEFLSGTRGNVEGVTAEFNEELIRVQVIEGADWYTSFAADANCKRQTFELRYEDIQEMVDNAMSLLGMMGTMAGVDIDLDALAELDFETIADALIEFVNVLIRHCASVETDAEGNTVARINVNNVGLLEAANEWIDLFLNNTKWQDAFVDVGSTVINSFGSMMGSIDEDMSIIGDLSLGDLLSRSGLCDAVRQLRDTELKQMMEQAQANPSTAIDFQYAVASNGDFAYLFVDVAGAYNRLERALDVRYEGSDLVIKLGTDGYEKVIVSSTDASRINIEYKYGENTYWTGYAKQTGSGNNWVLEVYDTYSFRGTPNSAEQVLLTVKTTGQQPFESLANAPDIQRITWSWILQNAFGSSGSRYGY